LKYKKYPKLANNLKDVIICGRLGEYRYYDMDRVIGRAMIVARDILVNS